MVAIEDLAATIRHIHIMVKISFSTFIINKKNVVLWNNQINPITKYRVIVQMEMSGFYFGATTRHIWICLVVAPNIGHIVFKI